MSRGLTRMVQQREARKNVPREEAIARLRDSGLIAEMRTPSRRDEEKAPRQSFWSSLIAPLKGGHTAKNGKDAKASSLSQSGSVSTLSSFAGVQPPVRPGPGSYVGRPEVQAHSLAGLESQVEKSDTATNSHLPELAPSLGSRMGLEESVSRMQSSSIYRMDTYRIMQLVDPDNDMSDADLHPAQLRGWLALVALERPAARGRAIRLHGTDAALFNSIAHECLANPADTSAQSAILRLLQDVCTTSGQLPTSYWLTDVIVNYRDCIGRGGEALVYMGTYRGENVVVRQVSPLSKKEWTSPLGRKTFTLLQREIVMHAQLRHTNIIPLLGVFRESESDPPMMILPFMEKGSASDYLKTLATTNVKFLALTVIGIIHNITGALAYLHTRDPPVLHGDLHPGNILIDSTGNALLCDFGFSRIRHEITRTRTDIREGGRGRFLAPELSSGPDAFRTSQASDVYSLAMTFLALGTMNPPFEEYPRELEAMHAARQGVRPKRPQSLLFPVEHMDGLWSLMEEMWAHELTDRPSALEVEGRIPPPPSLDSVTSAYFPAAAYA